MTEPEVIGRSLSRIDGREKVLGQSEYAGDIHLPDMLHLKVLRSQVPHARIKSIEVSAAKALPGVAAVFTAQDIPGPNRVGIILKDEPILADDKVRRVGDPLALVAAEDERTAAKALGLIKVELEELPPVLDVFAAMDNDAPRVHDKGNILDVTKIKKGDAQAAIEHADVVVTRRYTTQRVEHAYIEPEAGVAYLEGEVLTIKVSTQNPHFDRREIARNLCLPLNRVRVIQATTGGGFGGKLDISVQCYLGLAALRLKRPVKMVYSREESFLASVKRHPYVIDYTTAATKEGRLLAVRARIYGDTGAYASYGPAVLKRAAVHATGPYEVPNVDIEAYCVYTNNPASGAMRGFGVPQIAFAHESQMDLLARECGISPLAIRRRNVLKVGSRTATGQELRCSVGIGETLEKAWQKACQVIPGLGGLE
ncbi:MAG: xanthine dehydrogenase family protein molybdopterin-binding subunit [Moorellaceae bacterium]